MTKMTAQTPEQLAEQQRLNSLSPEQKQAEREAAFNNKGLNPNGVVKNTPTSQNIAPQNTQTRKPVNANKYAARTLEYKNKQLSPQELQKKKQDLKTYNNDLASYMRANASPDVLRGKFSADKNIQAQRQKLIQDFRNNRYGNPQVTNQQMPANPSQPLANQNSPVQNYIKPAGQQFTNLIATLKNPQNNMQPASGQNQNFYTDKTNYGKPMPSLNDLLNKGTDQQTQQAPLNQANNPTSQNNPQPTSPMQAQPNQQPQQAEAPAQDNAAIDQQIAALQAQIQQLQSQKK